MFDNISKKGKFSFLLIILICIVWIVVAFSQKKVHSNDVIKSDVLNYYSYLPAFIIEGDMEFKYRNEIIITNKEEKVLGVEMENGMFVPKMSMGMALLYLPFFLLGHVCAYLFNYPLTGFSMPYTIFMVIGHLFYVCFGLFYLRKILLEYFSDKVTLITIAAIAICSNLFYYATTDFGMSHAYSFCLYSLFLWYTIKWNENPKVNTTIIIGVLLGIIALVRPTNIIISVVFMLWGVTSKEAFIDKGKLFLKHWKLVLLLMLFSLVIISPQLIFWKITSGQFFFFSYGEEGFFFDNPQIFKGLFSYRSGWLLYTPIMIFALLGFVFLFRDNKKLAVPFLIFTTLNIYIVFSWWCWWYGAGFGLRALVDSYAILAFPLAAFIHYCFNNSLSLKIICILIVLFTSILNITQTIQYRYCLHYDSMTKEAYWEIFFARNNFEWPDGYRGMLRKPDYSSAMKGEKEIFDKPAPVLSELDQLIKRIKSDSVWLYQIEQKAIEKGISVDSALVRDARYVLKLKSSAE